MISPFVIKYILFWLGVAFNIYVGIQSIRISFLIGLGSGGWGYFFLGLGYLIVGPIFVRFFCELMLLFFRYVEAHCEINDSLKDIKKDMQRK
jgi:hypothetical protein